MSLRLLSVVLDELLKHRAMTNGVKNWPDNCDPRFASGGACFCAEGYFNAYPAPWRFEVTVANALPPNDVFNGVWFVDFLDRGGPFDTCNYVLNLTGGEAIVINKFWEDGSAPDGATVAYDIGFDNRVAVPPRFDGFGVRLVQPLPADTLPPGTPGGDQVAWPTPVIVRPVAWDFFA